MENDQKEPRRLMDRAERRRQVLDAARKMFVAHGYGGTSMRAIAQEAGVNEALLYRIAPSKEQLFTESVALPLEDAVQGVLATSLDPPADSTDADVIGRSQAFLRDLIVAMRDISPLLITVMQFQQQSGGNFYAERIEALMEETVRTTESNLPLWAHREFDPALFVRVVYGMCWFLAIDERFGSGMGKSLDELTAELMDMFLFGLARQSPVEPDDATDR